jgi:hypothetical protein
VGNLKPTVAKLLPLTILSMIKNKHRPATVKKLICMIQAVVEGYEDDDGSLIYLFNQ